jgi:hypothetical protein
LRSDFGDIVASGAQVLFKNRAEKQFLSYIVPGHFLGKSLATAVLVIMVFGTSDVVIALLDVAVVPGDGVGDGRHGSDVKTGRCKLAGGKKIFASPSYDTRRQEGARSKSPGS